VSRSLRALIAGGVALAALAALPSLAHAFADAGQFVKTAPNAATFGATSEGLYFTGAPRFASLDCSTCHVGGPQKVGLRLNADDPSLFDSGYVPGKVYELQVLLTNETEGVFYDSSPSCTDPPAPGDTFKYVQCNNNGFGLEIDTSDGPLPGSNVYCAQPFKAGMCPMPDTTADQALVAPGGDAVFDSKVYASSTDPALSKTIVRNGAVEWKFYWTAPKANTGALTVYVAAVDGNGGAGTATNDQDPYNDDTVAANFFLQESGAPVHNSANAGCSIARADAPAPAWLLAPLALLLVARRRRRGEARDG
jgi:MYXO-CTERM domain-containing protein